MCKDGYHFFSFLKQLLKKIRNYCCCTVIPRYPLYCTYSVHGVLLPIKFIILTGYGNIIYDICIGLNNLIDIDTLDGEAKPKTTSKKYHDVITNRIMDDVIGIFVTSISRHSKSKILVLIVAMADTTDFYLVEEGIKRNRESIR